MRELPVRIADVLRNKGAGVLTIAPDTLVADLISGLVVIAALVLAAAALPRLRAGPRAIVTIAIGIVGLIVSLVITIIYFVLSNRAARSEGAR